MDQPGNANREVEEALRDLGRLNRFFGGVRTVRWHLERMVGAQAGTTISILDIATGGADIPRALCRWARRRGLRLVIDALDGSRQVLRAAGPWCAPYPEIRLQHGVAPPLPYPDGSFDYAITSLFLHHLTEDQGVTLLREMERVARRGLIVSDLRRSRTGRQLTALATRLLSHNRLTRHDGPVSILRGFRPEEMRRMAARAGLRDARIQLHPWFRVVLIQEDESGPPPWEATP
jgi:ubiquinone/menaquinone biosynthesis C-methylase UbiE